MSLLNQLPETVFTTKVDELLNWGRASSQWYMLFGLACCAIELMQTGGPRADIDRFGAGPSAASRRLDRGASEKPGQDHAGEMAGKRHPVISVSSVAHRKEIFCHAWRNNNHRSRHGKDPQAPHRGKRRAWAARQRRQGRLL